MIEEVKELIDRNSGNISDTTKVIDQLILIYSILKTEKNFNKSFTLMYENLAFHLQILKTQLQIEESKFYSIRDGNNGK